MDQELLQFTYDEGSVTLILEEFFPASLRRLDKLLKLVDEERCTVDPPPQELRARLAAYCYSKARDLERHLPEMQATARSAYISWQASLKVVEDTRKDIEEKQEAVKGLDILARRKARDQIRVAKELLESRRRASAQAKAYAAAMSRERDRAASAAELLRKNRERILKWETRNETK